MIFQIEAGGLCMLSIWSGLVGFLLHLKTTLLLLFLKVGQLLFELEKWVLLAIFFFEFDIDLRTLGVVDICQSCNGATASLLLLKIDLVGSDWLNNVVGRSRCRLHVASDANALVLSALVTLFLLVDGADADQLALSADGKGWVAWSWCGIIECSAIWSNARISSLHCGVVLQKHLCSWTVLVLLDRLDRCVCLLLVLFLLVLCYLGRAATHLKTDIKSKAKII